MSIDTKILDGAGGGYRAKVDAEGTINVVAHDHPPRFETRIVIPYVEYFTNSAGAFDMRVDGSVTSTTFEINALEDFNIYIRNISVVIADAGATLQQFGNIGALANGVDLCWDTQDLGITQIGSALISNFDFVELAQGQPAFGSGNSSFKANNVVGISEAFIPNIDLTRISSAHGLRLRKGTNDKLLFKINDNLTGVDRFTCKAFGIKIGD